MIDDEEYYKICFGFNQNNPYCLKSDDYFTYASTLSQEENGDFIILEHWLYGEPRCQTVACSDFAEFVVRDGDGCALTDELMSVTIDGVDEIQCSASVSDSCLWRVPSPQCSHFVSVPKPPSTTTTTTTTSGTDNTNNYVIVNDDDDNEVDGGGSNDKNSDRSTFDAMTNKGGHFAESAMFYILLAFCMLTIVCIIGCVYKHSQEKSGVAAENDEVDVEEGVVEEPIQFEEEISL